MFSPINTSAPRAAIAVGALALVTTALAAPALASARTTATPQCSNADLSASYAYSSSGAGSSFGWIRLRNVSRHSCVTGGYGGISYVGHGNGTQIGAAADRTGGVARTFVLTPGQSVRSAIREVTALNYPRSRCRPVKVDGFRIYVPNATRSQYVVHPTTGCTNPAVHLLDHRRYVRG